MSTVQILLYERIAPIYTAMREKEKSPKSVWDRVVRRVNKSYYEYKYERHTRAMLDELVKAIKGV